jgi:transketolase
MLPVALRAAEALGAQGVGAGVVSLHTVKPLDEGLLAEVFARCEAVVTVEEHSLLGGLGGAVAEWLADRPGLTARLLRVGTADAFLHEAGDQEYARRRFGLTPEAIAERVLAALWGRSPGAGRNGAARLAGLPL